MLTGGCLCGRVRYAARGKPFHATICHCASCRRAVGAASVAWFSVLQRDLAFVEGTPARFPSSAAVVRGFCEVCGTSLTYESADHPDEVDLTICSLDTPDALVPEDHTQVSDALDWSAPCDRRPAHAYARPS